MNNLQLQKLLNEIKNNPISYSELPLKAIELATHLQNLALKNKTFEEKRVQAELARMMKDPFGKTFTTALTDQCFRASTPKRIVNQIQYLIRKFGIPKYLSTYKKIQLYALNLLGCYFPRFFSQQLKKGLHQATNKVIIPFEDYKNHLLKRKKEGVRININHIGEAILGEREAETRLNIYLKDLEKEEVEYVSIKISTLCSQINPLSFDKTVSLITHPLRLLYRKALNHFYTLPNGKKVPKFINLDMEEYKDLHLTVAAFKKVLMEDEFKYYSAGIVLQSYLPESFSIQQELTQFAIERVKRGGAPIKIRLVKGANLAMEQVESSIKSWPLAPFSEKWQSDANFKKMLLYGTKKEHAICCHLGIGSHNLFDICLALILTFKNDISPYITFEMLEGMNDEVRKSLQEIYPEVLLYCPIVKKADFQNGIAYLIRRLDENTAKDNFLHDVFQLIPGSKEWDEQKKRFLDSFKAIDIVQNTSHRIEDRNISASFTNEPDTDWTIESNRQRIEAILMKWKQKKMSSLPLASLKEVDAMITLAKKNELTWANTSIPLRSQLLKNIAQKLREKRGDLIGVMVANTFKTVLEADSEVSEAIDFAEYYRQNVEDLNRLEDLVFKAKGTILITPPWNFPCSIPAGGILAALMTGNCVIFKPAPEAVFVGIELVEIFWEAGVSKEILQFLVCDDEEVGSQLIKDARINAVVLTGATDTAKKFLSLRPGLDLSAETGGKNAIIVTDMSDRDLAIKDIIHSAFSHAGQKCSACSLLILEKQVYDDPHFLKQLKDATVSLPVGSQWDLSTKVNPLIKPPNETLLKGLTQLDEGEEWLLEPKKISENLYTPGIKLGIKSGSFMHQEELFGPVLAVMKADNLQHAIKLANGTRYGLTSGLHSLDEREHQYWLKNIQAGNCYINRTITGAIVQRQPFGGCKESSFGRGFKAGGPNYSLQFMNIEEKGIDSSLESAQFYWKNYFSRKIDSSHILGQDNFLFYVPQNLTLRVQDNDSLYDVSRVIDYALICHCKIEVSSSKKMKKIPKNAFFIEEDESEFIKRLSNISRVRLLSKPTNTLMEAFAKHATHIIDTPVLANGRIELLNYLREVSLSYDYHRYGYIAEKRSTLSKKGCCNDCKCSC